MSLGLGAVVATWTCLEMRLRLGLRHHCVSRRCQQESEVLWLLVGVDCSKDFDVACWEQATSVSLGVSHSGWVSRVIEGRPLLNQVMHSEQCRQNNRSSIAMTISVAATNATMQLATTLEITEQRKQEWAYQE